MRCHDAALGTAVELGQDKPGQSDGAGRTPVTWASGVLAGVRVRPPAAPRAARRRCAFGDDAA